MFSVSVLEAKSVITAIYEQYGYDISGFAMSSLRLRIGRFLTEHSLLYPDVLISRIMDDPGFLDLFISEIVTGSPDLFRDPDLWIELRDNLLPGMLKEHKEFEILVPSSVTGDELYSMAILLRESGLNGKIRLHATCLNNAMIENIRRGILSQARHKTSQDNYRIFNPEGNLDEYIFHYEGRIHRSAELLKNIRFQVKAPSALSPNNRTRLILFRNRMIYVNQATKTRILSSISERMSPGAYLILGIRESLKGTSLDSMLSPVSPDLNIYIKNNT
jgi:chemotaxis protein methyltransferase CheR